MNFIFGIVVGVFIAFFCIQPDRLGDVMHWAGDKMAGREQMEIFNND